MEAGHCLSDCRGTLVRSSDVLMSSGMTALHAEPRANVQRHTRLGAPRAYLIGKIDAIVATFGTAPLRSRRAAWP